MIQKSISIAALTLVIFSNFSLANKINIPFSIQQGLCLDGLLDVFQL